MPKQFSEQPNIEYDFNLEKVFLDSFLFVSKNKLWNFYKTTGIGSKARPTNVPNIEKGESETILTGMTNAYVILGNDRPGGLQSGYGGRGHTGAGAIDIVAGVGGIRPINKINESVCFTNKNFSIDASRIYVSQKADIDTYLNLKNRGAVLPGSKIAKFDNSNGKAAVAIITDCIRLFARESIKLTTTHLSSNSLGGDVDISGIDIIAGHDVFDDRHSLQPMVKGDNLVVALQEIINNLNKLKALVVSLAENQEKINGVLINHKHLSGGALSVTDSVISKESMIALNKNLLKTATEQAITTSMDLGDITSNYLRPQGKKYINSYYNRVN